MVGLSRQIVSYLFVGVASAVVDVGTLQALLLAGSGTTAAVSVAFVVGLVFNYVCQQRLTFRARHSLRSALRFLAVVAVNYGQTLLFVHGTLLLGGTAVLGKLLSLPSVAVVGFVAGKFWTFRDTAAQPPG